MKKKIMPNGKRKRLARILGAHSLDELLVNNFLTPYFNNYDLGEFKEQIGVNNID